MPPKRCPLRSTASGSVRASSHSSAGRTWSFGSLRLSRPWDYWLSPTPAPTSPPGSSSSSCSSWAAGALISFFAGAQVGFSLPVLKQGWEAAEDGPPFCTIFAILFSAVTGFTQGVSMSGDLKNPAKSLPAGTFLAVGLSTVVYVVTVFALAGTLSSTELSSDYDSVKRVALVPRLVDLGVLSATLSSALASFLGAAGSHKPSRATACLSR